MNNTQDLLQRETPFLLLDIQKIRAAFFEMQAALPGVDIYYAVKVNPNPAIVEALLDTGCGFDLSSPGELALLRSLGDGGEKISYSHPMKTIYDIEVMMEEGVRAFVADNPSEIEKFRGMPIGDSTLQMRAAYSSGASKYDFSQKFGVTEERHLLDLAALATEIGFKTLGLTFHCGSQNTDPGSFRRALFRSREACVKLAEAGYEVVSVNMGGGFPSRDLLPEGRIEPYVAVFREEVEKLLAMGLQVKAEPGRYMVADALSLHCSVIGKAMRKQRPWYYIDDNIYNSLAGKWSDKATYRITVPGKTQYIELQPSAIAGNSLDSVDIVEEDIWLPPLEIGDRLTFHDLGAYSTVFACEFNGIPITPTILSHGTED